MLPFLRSPPFPGVDRAVARVSEGDRGSPCAASLAAARAALPRLREARVGGAFWGIAVQPGGTIVSLIGDDDAPAFLAERATIVRDGKVLGKDGPADPWRLLDGATALWCGPDDELGWIAGVLDVPVRRLDGTAVAVADLHEAAARALAAARYRDPFTGEDGSVADAIALLSQWRRLFEANRRIGAVVGISWWKRRQVARFLWDGLRSPSFLAGPNALRRARVEGTALAVWPSRVAPALVEAADRNGVPLVRIEDGFIRSQGLGADFNLPWSLVVDTSGVHYDPSGPSDLETTLNAGDFSPPMLERAAALRQMICARGVSKYGHAASGAGVATGVPAGRRTILAIGQVEDDQSVRLGGGGVRTNRDFLLDVRRAEPDAFVVYRPHPDVLAGQRRGHITSSELSGIVDRTDSTSALLPLLAAVDCVHVLSSLTGFEALLRGRAVVVHGMPFYAGWGLTRDLLPPPAGRTHGLDLDQLVAGALIAYPRYLDPVTRLPCPPEVLVDRLTSLPLARPSLLVRSRRVSGRLRRWWTRVKAGR